jgi:hypothetical protein
MHVQDGYRTCSLYAQHNYWLYFTTLDSHILPLLVFIRHATVQHRDQGKILQYYLNRFAASLHGCPHATSSLRSYRPARDTHAAIMAVRFGTAQFRGPINLTSITCGRYRDVAGFRDRAPCKSQKVKNGCTPYKH